jgi:hypothetical protein
MMCPRLKWLNGSGPFVVATGRTLSVHSALILRLHLRGPIHHHHPLGDAHLRHDLAGEGGPPGGGAVGGSDFQEVAGAEVLHRSHDADRLSGRRERGQADQVGEIEFVCVGRGQGGALDVELEAAQRLGLFAGGNLARAGDQGAGDGAAGGQGEGERAILAPQRAVIQAVMRTSPRTPKAPAA